MLKETITSNSKKILWQNTPYKEITASIVKNGHLQSVLVFDKDTFVMMLASLPEFLKIWKDNQKG